MPEPSIARTIRLPVDVDKLLEEEDRRRGGRSKNEIIIEALRAYLAGDVGSTPTPRP